MELETLWMGIRCGGGRMLTTDNYECTWDLYKSIPSLTSPGKTVFDETIAFNKQHKFVEIPDDVVFTVEYSVRAAQIAVYEFFGIDRQVPPISPDKSLRVQFEALVKAFK
jgi:myosin-crossreactive antigen